MEETVQFFQVYQHYLLAAYLGICSVTDLWVKRISLTLTGVFFAIGMLRQLAVWFACFGGTNETGAYVCDLVITCVLSLLPGMFLLAVSLITGKQLGMADACAFFTCGIFLGLYQTILLLMLSLFVTGICGISLLLFHKGLSRGTDKKSKHRELPFLPFVFASFLFMMGCLELP